MIKKYALQRKIDSDEEYEIFLKHDGLLVLDVYSGFFGPCTGMISTLRKLKEMDGYQDLHLAVCKSDNIKALEKYRNSCKPTWLFIINGTETDIMIGANSPKLEKLINKQLLCVPKKCPSLLEVSNENEDTVTEASNGNEDNFPVDSLNDTEIDNDDNKENLRNKINKLNKQKKPTDDDQPKYSILEFF